MILPAYRLATRVLAPAIQGLVLLRAMYGHEEIDRRAERKGVSSLPRPQGTLLWVHAASVGEMRSALPLVQHLLAKNPAMHCLITTVTVTAARLVRQTNHSRILHQYAPFDHPAWDARFLDHWRPDAVLWLESELWPTMLQAVKARGIPLMMVNGRLSERSANRWAYVGGTIAHVLSQFDLCLAQSQDDAARLKKLGAKHVLACGNMKYAGRALPHDAEALESLRVQIGARPVMLFASTHEGEEAIAARTFARLKDTFPDLLLIVLPRHPVRGAAIADILEQDGLRTAVRSRKAQITPETQAYVADTLGEPGLFYRLCPVVYLGNSLISSPGGGHNPIEPAHLGCAIVYGHNMWNFSEIETDLRRAGGAIMVHDEKALADTFRQLLTDSGARARMADAARGFVEAQNGVLETILGQLRPHLERAKIAA